MARWRVPARRARSDKLHFLILVIECDGFVYYRTAKRPSTTQHQILEAAHGMRENTREMVRALYLIGSVTTQEMIECGFTENEIDALPVFGEHDLEFLPVLDRTRSIDFVLDNRVFS